MVGNFLSLEISALAAEFSLPPNILDYICSCRQVFNSLTAFLTALLSGFLSSQSSQCYWGYSKFLGRTAP